MLPNLGAVGFGRPVYAGVPANAKSSVGQAISWKISSEGKLLRKKGQEDSWHEMELPSAATIHSRGN